MDQGRVIVDFLIVLNMVLFTLIVIRCILAILTIDVMPFGIFIGFLVCCVHKGRR